ncbi:MAG: hypothetical protein OEV87_01900 [Phycisphaerae bacterium]|nr:hypothetical protein [Phycisphaerae bacterium]
MNKKVIPSRLFDILHQIQTFPLNEDASEDKMPGTPKECVFCGLKPNNKTKEHVLPQWLLEFTGDKKREITLNVYTPEAGMKQHTLAFDNLVFPACDTCNNNFSHLEDKVKIIFQKVNTGLKINAEEAEKLLDWFDKIRVGMWLGGLMWSKNWMGIAPNYRIQERNGLTDRVLYIGHTNEQAKGLNFSNITDVIFMGNPLFLFLRVNNLSFLNLVGLGIAAGSMGLPKIKPIKREGKMYEYEVKKPKNENYKENWPATAKSFSILSQAIYNDALKDQVENDEFYWKNITNKTKSKIGLQKDGQFSFMGDEEESILSDSIQTFNLMLKKSEILYRKLRMYTVKNITNSVNPYERLWTRFYREFASTL